MTSPDSVFAILQRAVDTWSAEHVAAVTTDDVIWIGTGSYCRGRQEFLDYTRDVFAANDSLRWELDRKDVILDREATFCFAAEGTIIGERDGREQRLPFRVTILAERTDDSWRYTHFHGSVPMGAFNLA